VILAAATGLGLSQVQEITALAVGSPRSITFRVCNAFFGKHHTDEIPPDKFCPEDCDDFKAFFLDDASLDARSAAKLSVIVVSAIAKRSSFWRLWSLFPPSLFPPVFILDRGGKKET
jgi:hypothetical protein